MNGLGAQSEGTPSDDTMSVDLWRVFAHKSVIGMQFIRREVQQDAVRSVGRLDSTLSMESECVLLSVFSLSLCLSSIPMPTVTARVFMDLTVCSFGRFTEREREGIFRGFGAATTGCHSGAGWR